MSLNGLISGSEEGSFTDYASPEDEAWLKRCIDESDVLVMGRKTYEIHVKKHSKPLIVFSKQVKHFQVDQQKNPEVHWFNDSPENFDNLCNLLKYKKITILGGAQIYHWFLYRRLITDLYLTVEPFLLNEGTNLLEGKIFRELKGWKLKEAQQLNDRGTLLLHYQL